MEPGLNARPPRLLERMVWRILPPMVREEVAGDLWERFRSPVRYAIDAVATLPFIIVSQIRRTTSLPLFILQAFTLFLALGGFEPSPSGGGAPMWLRALIATVPAVMALLLRAAYRPSNSWTGGRAAADLLWTLLAVLGSQLVAGLIDPAFCVPIGFLVGGLLFALTMLLVLRSGIDLVSIVASPEAIEQDYQLFRRNVRFKNTVEIGLLLPLLGVAFWFATTARPIVAAIGFLWVALTLLIMTINLYGRPQPMPVALTQSCQLAFYRVQLARQRRVIGVAWWWYFVPLFGGLGVLILRGIVAGQMNLVVAGAMCMPVLAIMIAKANQLRSRQFGDKIATLDRLARI